MQCCVGRSDFSCFYVLLFEQAWLRKGSMGLHIEHHHSRNATPTAKAFRHGDAGKVTGK